MRFVSGLVMLFLVAGSISAHPKRRHAETKPQHKHPRSFNARLNEDLSSEVRYVLERAEVLELFSIEPGVAMSIPNQDSLPKPHQGGMFLGHQVLGQTAIREARVKRRLISALYSGIVHSWEVMGCFRPRHGLRATYKRQTVELVICFECRVYQGAFGEAELAGKISKAPEKLFDQILLSARVPLSEK